MKATEKIMATQNIQSSDLRFHVSKTYDGLLMNAQNIAIISESILCMQLDYDIFLVLTLPQQLKRGENRWQSHTIGCENCLWTRK